MKLRHLLSLSALCSMAAVSTLSAQTTIGFEGAPCDDGDTPFTTFAGFTWSNTYCTDATEPVGSGYNTLRNNSGTVAFNGFGEPAAFSSASTFTLNSLMVAPAWNNGLNLTLTGFFGMSQLFTQSFVLTGPATAQTLNLGWEGINRVTISTFGGTDVVQGGSGTQVAFDNVVVNGPTRVPEPASLVLLGSGLVGMAVARRRRA